MKRIFLIIALVLGLAGAAKAERCPTMAVLGDSYSTFQDYVVPDTNFLWYQLPPGNRNDVTDVTQTWWHILADKMGYKIGHNNAFSGSTICNTGYDKADFSDRSFITRMNNLGEPDVIFIFGCTNDSWANSPIGEYKWGDWTKEDLYNFRPAMAKMADYMNKRYRNVDVYFIVNCDLKENIYESIREVADHYGMKTIWLRGIDKQKGHPSVKGMQQIADQVEQYLAAEKAAK